MNTREASTTDLLDTARMVLLETLLPQLRNTHGYECRMIARAMSIAAREMEGGAEAKVVEANSLSEVMAHFGLNTQGVVHDRSRLAGLIRNGTFDANSAPQAQLLDALMRITRARLAISNPKALRDER